MTKTVVKTTIVKFKGMHADFMGMALDYVMSEKSTRETSFIFGQIYGMSEIESQMFIEYLWEYWNAYMMDIINGEYKYVNLTEIVYSSWLEYIENM